MRIFATFILATCKGGYAATTRAADRGEAGKIGLPGGKVDPGEDPRDAAIREAAEEGWDVSGVEEAPAHIASVEGQTVVWFRANSATPRSEYKEQGRIAPIPATLAEIAASGYGNDWVEEIEITRATTARGHEIALRPGAELPAGSIASTRQGYFQLCSPIRIQREKVWAGCDITWRKKWAPTARLNPNHHTKL